jgi:hypothetical protein
MSTNPNLTALIRQAAADNPLADPRELAKTVAAMTPDEDLLDFYTEALVDACLTGPQELVPR